MRRTKLTGSTVALFLLGWLAASLGPPDSMRQAEAAPADTWVFDKEGIQVDPDPLKHKDWHQWFLIHDAPNAPDFAHVVSSDKATFKLSADKEDDRKLVLSQGLHVLVSADGDTVIEFGDRGAKHASRQFRMHWRFADGAPLAGDAKARVSDYFPNEAHFSMAEDGHVAVAWRSKPAGEKVRLYDNHGKLLFERTIPTDKAVRGVLALSGRRGVLVRTARAKHPLKDHRLGLLEATADAMVDLPLAWEGKYLRIDQRVVPLGDGRLVFVQGRSHIGLFDTERRKPVWIRRARVRLASPSGAALGPSGTKTLLLASLEDKNKVNGTYTIRLRALDLATGAQLGEGKGRGAVNAPGRWHGTWGGLFERISAKSITLITPEVRITFPFKISK